MLMKEHLLLGWSSDTNTGEPEHLISCKVPCVSQLPSNLSEMGKLTMTTQVRSNHQLFYYGASGLNIHRFLRKLDSSLEELSIPQ
jgi:hypothetical protein